MISVFKFKIYRKLSLICNCDMSLSGFGFHILGFFITICRFSLGGASPSWRPGLSWWLRWLGGRRLYVPAWASFAWCMRLPCLADCVSWCELGGGVLRLPGLARHLFFPNIWGLAKLTKLKPEMRICRTKFDTVTLVVHHLRGMNGIPFLTEH